MSRDRRVLSQLLSPPIGASLFGEGVQSAMLARAQAYFKAEREDFVKAVADQTVKDRLSEQISHWHDLQLQVLIQSSEPVSRFEIGARE